MPTLNIQLTRSKVIVGILAIITFAILIGVLFFKKDGGLFLPIPPAPTPILNTEEKRDNQRKEDLSNIGKALDAYATSNDGMFPSTNDNIEKISDENNSIYLILKSKNLLSKPYKDPVPDNFYGYKSNGYYYELTAVFESKNNKECFMNGNYCIYTIGNYSYYDYDDYPYAHDYLLEQEF